MLDEKEINLSDELSIQGKMFFAALAAYVTGKAPDNNFIKIKGTPEQMKALADAVAATKSLYDEINKPTTTIEEIIRKMNDKKNAAEDFREKIGHSWPL
jgi:hypothetical protein